MTRVARVIVAICSIRIGIARGLALCLTLFGAGWLIGALFTPTSATVLDARELDGVAVRGGVLDLVAVVDQHRPCVTAVRRWLWRPDPLIAGGIEWVFLPDAPFRPPNLPGLDRYRLRVPVPSYVEDGTWNYLGDAEDECSPLDAVWRWFSPARRTPPIGIHILSPTPATPATVIAPPGPVTIIPSTPAPKESP